MLKNCTGKRILLCMILLAGTLVPLCYYQDNMAVLRDYTKSSKGNEQSPRTSDIYKPGCISHVTDAIVQELKKIAKELEDSIVRNEAPSSLSHHRITDIIEKLSNHVVEDTTKHRELSSTKLTTVSSQPTSSSYENKTEQNVSSSAYEENVTRIAASPRYELCPEIYEGTKFGYPYYFKGWHPSNCTDATNLSELVTIAINAVNSNISLKQLKHVLEGIYKTYPNITVLVAISKKAKKEISDFDVITFEVEKPWSVSVGKVWNDLLEIVTTPYVLIARDLYDFSRVVTIGRQVRMISETVGVQIAGGSYRNASAHWKTGCYQLILKNYFLDYQDGYFHSKNDCMFCDHVEGPFVGRTSVLQELKFDENLKSPVLFNDLFLRLKERHFGTLICPDSMYFMDETENVKQNNRTEWTKGFVKKWELNRIRLPDGNLFSFSCSESEQNCALIDKITNDRMIPICCQDELAKFLKFFHEFCKRHKLPYEFQSGLLVGAVKVQDLLPYDRDGDCYFHNDNFTFFKNKQEYFKKQGFLLTNFVNNNYFEMYTPNIRIEMYGLDYLSANEKGFPPTNQRGVPTLVNVHGVWVWGVFSPAQYARNRYGSSLQHSIYWRKQGANDSWVHYEPRPFPKCKKPKHHSCQDKFYWDGNIQFKVPSKP